MGFAKKVLRFVLPIAAIAVNFIPGIGQLASFAIQAGLAIASSALAKKGKAAPSTINRQSIQIDTAALRTGVVGYTALPIIQRYGAYTGTGQEYYEQILGHASHRLESVEEYWFDGELAWTVGGGAQGRFAGYLDIDVVLEGTSGNSIPIDGAWDADCRLTGCAYSWLKYKLSDNSKSSKSPFAQGLPSRVTARGKGGLVYDPRLDSTNGGSGAHRPNDQTTWAYATAAESGRNPACQALFVLLGWKIGGLIAIGAGYTYTRIDYASFITAANICDESVALAAGGTEKRYCCDGVWDDGEAPETVLTRILQSMNAELTDENGKLAIRVDYNDLASPVVAFTQADIIDGDAWNPSDSEADSNVVRGRYTAATNGALYQLLDYPQVTLTGSNWGSVDGIQRVEPFDLSMVQSPTQAQRLAKLRLQRKQYPGTFSARFKMKAWAASYGRPVTLSHSAEGWSAKKFRVLGQKLRRDGSVDLLLREHETAMYSWSAEEAATVTPAVPTVYDPANDPLRQAIAEIEPAPVDVLVINFDYADDAARDADWETRSGSAETSYGTDLTAEGASYMRVGNNSGNDARWMTWRDLTAIPFDPAYKYRLSGKARQSAGTGPFYLGLLGVGADGETLVSYSGADTWDQAHWICNDGDVLGGSFAVTSGYVQGRSATGSTSAKPDPLAPGVMHSDVAFIAPAFIANSDGSSGHPDLDWIRIERFGTDFEIGSEANREIGYGPPEIVIRYDYEGAAEDGQLPRSEIYKLVKAGTPLTAGVTWSYRVVTGTFNGFNSASGEQSVAGAGSLELPVTTLETAEAVIELIATEGGKTVRSARKVRKDIAAAPGGSGSSGGLTTIADKTSGWTAVTNTSFGDKSGTLTGTMPTGKTTAEIRATLNLAPAIASPDGTWNVEAKLMRETSPGTWTQIGSTVSSNPDPAVEQESGIYQLASDGTLPISIDDTGLTGGDTENWRLEAALTSGSKAIAIAGTLTIRA